MAIQLMKSTEREAGKTKLKHLPLILLVILVGSQFLSNVNVTNLFSYSYSSPAEVTAVAYNSPATDKESAWDKHLAWEIAIRYFVIRKMFG